MRDARSRSSTGARIGHGNHHVVEVDALAAAGPHSLEAVARQRLRPGVGTALLTEGLLGYFPGEVNFRRADVMAYLEAGKSADFVHTIHLDIASVADTEKGSALQPPGATGFGVRSLLVLLRGWSTLKL